MSAKQQASAEAEDKKCSSMALKPAIFAQI
jgi:hypothetical protein